MILEGILNLVKGVLLFVISLFPVLPDMSFLSQSVSDLLSLFVLIDSVVSVRLVGSCFSVLFIFTNVDLIWSVIMWVVRKIPGVS